MYASPPPQLSITKKEKKLSPLVNNLPAIVGMNGLVHSTLREKKSLWYDRVLMYLTRLTIYWSSFCSS